MRGIAGALGITAGLVLMGSIATASAAVGPQIRACTNDATGVVRIVDPARPGLLGRCVTAPGALHETTVTWNQVGPTRIDPPPLQLTPSLSQCGGPVSGDLTAGRYLIEVDSSNDFAAAAPYTLTITTSPLGPPRK